MENNPVRNACWPQKRNADGVGAGGVDHLHNDLQCWWFDWFLPLRIQLQFLQTFSLTWHCCCCCCCCRRCCWRWRECRACSGWTRRRRCRSGWSWRLLGRPPTGETAWNIRCWKSGYLGQWKVIESSTFPDLSTAWTRRTFCWDRDLFGWDVSGVSMSIRRCELDLAKLSLGLPWWCSLCRLPLLAMLPEQLVELHEQPLRMLPEVKRVKLSCETILFVNKKPFFKLFLHSPILKYILRHSDTYLNKLSYLCKE